MPKDLFDVYHITLERIRQQPASQAEMAMSVLMWVYFAERKLQVVELQHALAVQPGDTEFIEDGTPTQEIIVDCCLGLVVIERETSTIRLTHFTLQEYLDDRQDAVLTSGHTIITKTCLTYLGFDHNSESEKFKESSTFIEYVGTNLGHHMRKGSDATTDEMLLGHLSKSEKFSIIRMFMARLIIPKDPSEIADSLAPLHWVTFFGVYSIAEATLRAADDMNVKDNYWERTPLSFATGNGHDEVVKLLINTAGVDVDSRDKSGRTPLSWAAGNGHDAVVKLLINAGGVDVNSRDKHDRTPLFWAAVKRNEAVVKLLINAAGVDVNSRDAHGGTPLYWAATYSHEAIVKLLINITGVDVNSRDNYDRTPLFWAAIKGNEAVVKLLINTTGVDVNSRDKYGQTTLSSAAIHAHEATVKLLIDKAGVDLNSRDHNGQTPLSLAAKKGHDAIVQLLQSATISRSGQPQLLQWTSYTDTSFHL